MKVLLSLVMAMSLLCASGCTPNIGGRDYSVADSGHMSETFSGTVISMHAVEISNKSPKDQGKAAVGAGVGGATGGLLAASTIGNGNGSLAAGVVGALAGGILGHYAEKELKRQKGMEYAIKLDDGRSIAVAQGLEPRLCVGQRVTVIQGKERTRVVAL